MGVKWFMTFPPFIPVGMLCVGNGGGGGGGFGMEAVDVVSGVGIFAALVVLVMCLSGLSVGAVFGGKPARRRLILESSVGCIASKNAGEAV